MSHFNNHQPGETTDYLHGLALDRSSYVPCYRQIYDHLTRVIKSGKVMPGQPIWPEGICAQKFGVSKMTVRQAFQDLRAEGLLVVARGKRPIVGPGRIQKNFQELRGFTEEMARRGLKATSKLLSIECVSPNPVILGALQLSRREKAYCIRRLRLANGQLVGWETSHLACRLFPDLDKQDLEKQSLYSLVETRYGIRMEWSEEEIESVPAKEEVQKLLQVPHGFPLLFMRRTVYTARGVPVEYGHSYFRGDRYSATVISRRKP